MDSNSLENDQIEKFLIECIQRLSPVVKPKRKSHSGDWLSIHEESGQPFEEYIHYYPNFKPPNHNFLFIQPLGIFSNDERRILTSTAKFLEAFFSMPTQINEEIPLTNIPPFAHRVHPTWGNHQYLSTYILDKILKPNIPPNAAAYIAFTAADLWPGRGWNFVFGQASLRDRVGVWSMQRYGDHHGNKYQFQLCLLRTMKTAAHEICHTFGLAHCVSYECLMNGSNSLEESDTRPLACCAECMAKICWYLRQNPIPRYKQLSDFCLENEFPEQARLYSTYASILEDLNESPVKNVRNNIKE